MHVGEKRERPMLMCRLAMHARRATRTAGTPTNAPLDDPRPPVVFTPRTGSRVPNDPEAQH